MGRTRRTPVEGTTASSSTAVNDVMPSTSSNASDRSIASTPINILSQSMQQMAEMMLHLTQNVNAMTQKSGSSEAPRKQVNVEQPIPPFNPEDENGSIIKFINNIEQLAKINHWDEHTKIYKATSSLQGLAKTWYNSQAKIDYDWTEWKQILTRTFPEDIDYENLLAKIVQRLKKPDEEMLTYYYEKLALISHFTFEDKVIVNLLIGGLKNYPEIQAGAKAGNHGTPESLLQYLKTFKKENVSATTLPREKRHVFPKKRNNFKPYHGETRDKVKCFFCNKAGHIAPECPRKREDKQKTVMATRNGKVNMSSKYFMHVRVNERKERAFVDFGSTV